MHNLRLVPSFVLCAVLASAAAAAEPAIVDNLEPSDVILASSVESGELPEGAVLTPVPAGAKLTEHVYADGASSTRAGDPTGTLVYSNVRGAILLTLPAGFVMADDVFTTAVGGCNLAAYEVLVSGGGDGSGPGFTVDFALYDACPGNSGQIIPGTAGSMDVLDDGLHLLTVDLAAAPVPVGSALWVGTSFSSASAGWMVGSQADIGFTDDVYDMVFAPRCEARFGGTDLHAGFSAKLYCDGAVDTQFLGYLNSGPGDVVARGANRTVLDDVALFVDDCVLSGYEVGLIGNAGSFSANIELWFPCDAAAAIPGTAFTFQGVGDGSVETARVSFAEGVPLPSPVFWVAVTPSTGATGPVVSGEPTIGTSEDLYALWDEPTSPDACNLYWFSGNPYAAFQITVFCMGDPPLGACCQIPPPPGSPPCAQTTELSCAPGRWIEGAVCDPDPFVPPCGTFACCLPTDTCENLTEEDCLTAGGTWQRDRFCDQGLQQCPFYACETGQGDCCSASTSAGCGSAACCDRVCHEDRWCCAVEWDQICADEARALCTFGCPAGNVVFLDPEDGVVDARQPHPLGDPTALQGIDAVRVLAPAGGANGCCWDVCETDHTGAPNSVTSVEDDGTGAYIIHLARPITTGAVTTITYIGTGAMGTFTSHPGNVNGDIETAPSDIIAEIDCINGLGACPWGLYGCDVDHDGQCGPSDIVGLVDVLNGAGEFTAWSGSLLPMNFGECP